LALTEALTTLQDAQEARAEFLVDALDNERVAEAAGDNAETATEANLQTALDASVTDLDTEIDGVLGASDFDTATENVREALITDALEDVQKDITDAQKALASAESDVSSALLTALSTVESRTTALESALKAESAAASALVGEEAAFDDANTPQNTAFQRGNVDADTGVFTAAADGSVYADATVSTTDVVVIAELNADNDWELNSDLTADDYSRLDQLAATLQADTDAQAAATTAEASLERAVREVVRIERDDSELEITDYTGLITETNGEVTVDFGADFDAPGPIGTDGDNAALTGVAAPEADTVLDARVTLSGHEETLADLEEAIADYREVVELNDQFETLDEAVDEARLAITNGEDEDPAGLDINLRDAGQDATSDDDLFLFSDDYADQTVADFGESGEDRLFFGEEYSLVQLDGAWKASADTGDAAALEIFWEQKGADLVLYTEEKAFAGNASTEGDIVKITLAGVNAEDVSFSNGYLTAGEPA
jgi:hypothetical protein